MARLAATLSSTLALLTAPLACAQTGEPVSQGAPNVPAFQPAFAGQTRAPAADSGVTLAVETIAEGLEHPWGVALLPDGG
jgi:glucose/arabinose dehydrogenase